MIEVTDPDGDGSLLVATSEDLKVSTSWGEAGMLSILVTPEGAFPGDDSRLEEEIGRHLNAIYEYRER